MKKVLTLLLCGLTLFTIEHIVLFFFTHLENLICYSVPWKNFAGALRTANEITAIRFIFYFVFWLVGVHFGCQKIQGNYPVLKLALLNCSLYIATSIFMVWIFPFAAQFFKASFFYYLVVATFISPFLLYTIPFFKRLIRNLVQVKKT